MLVLLLLGLVALDLVIWFGLSRLASMRAHPVEQAALKATAIAVIFSPGFLIGGHGGIPAPAILALLSEGQDWKFHALSLGSVFVLSFCRVYLSDRSKNV